MFYVDPPLCRQIYTKNSIIKCLGKYVVAYIIIIAILKPFNTYFLILAVMLYILASAVTNLTHFVWCKIEVKIQKQKLKI